MGKKMASGKRLAARRERNKQAALENLSAQNDSRSLRRQARIESGSFKPAKRRRTPVPGTGSRKAGDKTGARSR